MEINNPNLCENHRQEMAWTVILFAATFLYYTLFQNDIQGYDIWWHIETGRLILNDHFPRSDIYSYTAYGRPWVLHEWGSEIIFYLLYSRIGFSGLIWIKAMAAASAASLMFMILVMESRTIARTSLCLLVTIFALIGFHKTWGFRPQIFSLPFFLLLIYLIRRTKEEKNSWLLVAIPPMFVIWVNLHGGYFIGLIYLGIYNAGKAAEGLLDSGTFRIDKKLVLVLFSSMLMCLVNPNGVASLLYPLAYRSNAQIPLNFIAEWYPASMTNSRYYFVFILLLLVAVCFSRRKSSLTEILLLGFFNYYAIKHHRLTPNAIAVSMPFFWGKITELYARIVPPDGSLSFSRGDAGWPTEETHGRHKPPERLNRVAKYSNRLLISTLVLAAVFVSAVIFSGNGRAILRSEIKKLKYPLENIAVLTKIETPGNLFNQYRYGGLIILHLPGKKVFIDGRIDVYGQEIADEYDTVLEMNNGWQEIMKKYNISHVLVDKMTPLGRFLGRIDHRWKLVAEDSISVIYVKG